MVGLIHEISRHRSHRALAALYDYFAPNLQRVAMRVLQSRECAQEVVCDVFLTVWQNAGHYTEERGSVGVWLRAMTRNRAIDALRKNAKHGKRCLQFDDDLVADGSHPEGIVSDLQHQTFLHSALSTLTPLRQQLLRMAFFDGLSHDEIAQASGLSLGTVKSHVRRAMLSMRSVMTAVSSAPA